MASLLVVASESQEPRTALVVSDCCRWDSRTLDVAIDADTDDETDCRYAGATFVSGPAVPLVTVVQPTMPISAVAMQPSASAPRLGNFPPGVRGTTFPPVSTGSDVTGWRLPMPPTHRGLVLSGERSPAKGLRLPARRAGTAR